MENRIRLYLALTFSVILSILLTGCVQIIVEPTAPPPTETATPTLTPSPTIDWFPATPTPTLLPTPERTPTPDLKPEVGTLLAQDNFSSDADWTITEVQDGNITVSNNHITLALNQPDGLIYAVRTEPVLKDFYAEITAAVNFCQPGDEYGLMVRTTGERLDHYRLGLSCSGQAHAMRVINGRGTAVQDWITRPFIPNSFPSQVRLSVWVRGTTLRFFVNNILVFEITDPVIRNGRFGVYVFGSGGGPVSANFSDLAIYELETGE